MTVAQLKKSMDRRFRSVDRRIRSLKSEVHRLRAAIARSDDRNRRQFQETRRHFDVVAESLLDDLRIFADAIVRHSERLDQHDAQLTRLERRAQ